MEEERKIKCVTDSLARESSVAKCKERRYIYNDNGDLTSNGEWAKCKHVAAGDGDEASTCRFSSRLKWFLFCYHSLKMGYLFC